MNIMIRVSLSLFIKIIKQTLSIKIIKEPESNFQAFVLIFARLSNLRDYITYRKKVYSKVKM